MATHWFEEALVGDEIWREVRVSTDAKGVITTIEADAPADGALAHKGLAIPAMPNLHSHVFQRAMAGLAETSDGRPDDFWGWRERMYAFVERLEPEDMAAIAAQTGLEMLMGGYGSVAEFHYVHRDPKGRFYDDKAAMARGVVAGYAEAGIGVVFNPVVYMTAGMDGAPLSERQRRFSCTPTDAADIAASLSAEGCATGLALHSLRAVPAEAVRDAVALFPKRPVHVHVAEQTAEVEACLAATGRRPVERLFDLAPVDGRWCLVHATHMSAEETAALARSGAVAGICPSTEGDLGDGFFPLADYEALDGVLGLGSDSHVVLDAAEETRWLDYGLRLQTRKRFGEGRTGHRGAKLWSAAAAGGARALGWAAGGLAVGARADILVLDADHASQIGRSGLHKLDALVFSNQGRPFRTVISGGAVVIEDGRHPQETAIRARYRRALEKLVA